jgi:glycosyltransferase involved in cell wall biosynthesis
MPPVTVVMAVYNAAPFLREAVASVLSQTYRDFELIAVDDSSTDESLAVLQSFDDPRIRIIRHATNMGASVSRNDAIAAARGEMIAIMDGDDVCVPARLERQVAFLDAHPSVGLVGCGIYDNINASGAVLYTSLLPEDNESIQRVLMDKWCFLHSSILFRRVLHQSVGGYRAAFEPVEDHDFALRMVEHSQAHNLCERLVTYRLNPNGLTVIGHQYVDELRAIAIRLARQRRSGQPEDFDSEMPRVLALKQRRKAPRGFAGVVQRWRDSFYAANRYYGFGCRELCAGQLERARRCYVQSLRTNRMFVKSWIGFVLTLMPSVAHHLRFVFRSSMQEHNDPGWSRPSVEADPGHLTPVAHSTAAQ